MKTAILVQGLEQQQIEAFAEYVAEVQETGWLVRRAEYSTGPVGFFQLGFNAELSFRQVARISRALKNLGANVALSQSSWD